MYGLGITLVLKGCGTQNRSAVLYVLVKGGVKIMQQAVAKFDDRAVDVGIFLAERPGLLVGLGLQFFLFLLVFFDDVGPFFVVAHGVVAK